MSWDSRRHERQRARDKARHMAGGRPLRRSSEEGEGAVTEVCVMARHDTTVPWLILPPPSPLRRGHMSGFLARSLGMHVPANAHYTRPSGGSSCAVLFADMPL